VVHEAKFLYFMLLPKQTAFVNPQDGCCARALWFALLIVYVVYVILATLAMREEASVAEALDLHEEKITLPNPSIDVCELLAFEQSLNYSILGRVHVKVQCGWFWSNGNESHNEALVPAVDDYIEEEAFHCWRFRSTIEVPPGAVVTYYNFWIGVEEPVHPKLYRWNENYISGLVFRPSLSANATNFYAMKEERMMRLLLPTHRVPGFRNVVISARPSLAKWSDSLGGRRGAPCEDTFYFGDLQLIPEMLQREALFNESESEEAHSSFTRSRGLNVTKAGKAPVRYTLKFDMPVPTELVSVSRFTNDLVLCLLKWLSKLASATAIFKLVGVLFPVIERRSYQFAVRCPWLGLGNLPEQAPLLAKETTALP